MIANPKPPKLRGVTVRPESFEGWPVYRLSTGRAEKFAVFVHGGGWAAPITAQHWALAARIARESGREVVVPLYPRIPEATHDDVLPVMLRLFQHVRSQGPTALIGDSAGAQIVLTTLQALGTSAPQPDTSILVSPALDLTFSNPDSAAAEPRDPLLNLQHITVLGRQWSASNSLASPLNGRLDRLGPVHVFAGTRDLLYPDALILEAKAEKAVGTELHLHVGEGMLHDWPIMPTPEGRRAAAEIVALLR
nr:alpha/beta hydrolase [Kineosporia babensis]